MGKILVLEDDDGIAELVTRTLQKAGHEVVWISHPSAYDSSNEFDLLIVDYKLSDNSSGLEFYQHMKNSGSNLPAILATGFGDENVLVEALRMGVRDFLPKNQLFLEVLPLIVDRVMRDVQREHELEAARRMQIHTMEIHHRVKNSFQVVHSLLNMELRKHEVLDKNSVAKVVSHLQGLSLIHDILTENIASNRPGNSVSVADLVERLIATFQGSDHSREIKTSIDPLCVDGRIASSLAVILTELLINALKYGIAGIDLSIKAQENERAFLSIKNQPNPKIDKGLNNTNTGSVLVEFLAKSDFRCQINCGLNEAGEYFCEMSFPTLKK